MWIGLEFKNGPDQTDLNTCTGFRLDFWSDQAGVEQPESRLTLALFPLFFSFLLLNISIEFPISFSDFQL